MGLAKFGKGDWRSISRNFVMTRTPTQASCCILCYTRHLIPRHQAKQTRVQAEQFCGVISISNMHEGLPAGTQLSQTEDNPPSRPEGAGPVLQLVQDHRPMCKGQMPL